MKRMGTIGITCLLLIGGLVNSIAFSSLTAKAEGALIFEDDFEDGDMDGWEVLGGSASVVGGNMGTGLYMMELYASGETDAIVRVSDPASYSWSNYRVEALGRITAGNDAWSYLNLFLYVQEDFWGDPTMAPHNAYHVNYRDQQNQIMIIRWVNGVGTLLGTVGVPFGKGVVYELAAEVENGAIRAYLNGVLMLEVWDMTFNNGTIGLTAATGGGGWTWIQSHIDDVKVHAIGAIEVDIDIKPGSYPNTINMRSKGKIPVAILSSENFDAPEEVDWTSPTFGRTGDEPSLAKCSGREDVNEDGLDDLVCHFYIQKTGFLEGDDEGILLAEGNDGIPYEGRDSVRILNGG